MRLIPSLPTYRTQLPCLPHFYLSFLQCSPGWPATIYVAQARFKPIASQQSSCLSFLSSGFVGVRHHPLHPYLFLIHTEALFPLNSSSLPCFRAHMNHGQGGNRCHLRSLLPDGRASCAQRSVSRCGLKNTGKGAGYTCMASLQSVRVSWVPAKPSSITCV